MCKRIKCTTAAILLSAVCAIPALNAAAQTAPSTSLSLPNGPLTVKVSALSGKVQVRLAPDKEWQVPTIGMTLPEGAELRTASRSAVQITIDPDQTITLDRLGELKILRANFESGKVFTDLGMKFGRTRYDIEAAGREHDAKVRTPSSVLAVRGTQFIAFDQPPFAPEATSLTGRVMFRDAKKLVSVGSKGGGKAKVNTELNNSAQYALNNTIIDPKGAFAGRSATDVNLQAILASYGGADFSNLGVLSFLQQAANGTFKGTVIGVLPIEQQLLVTMQFSSLFNELTTDVDLSLSLPDGSVLSAANPRIFDKKTGLLLAQHDGNLTAPFFQNGQPGDATESAGFGIRFPAGTYTFQGDLKVDPRLSPGTTSDVIFTVTDFDPLHPENAVTIQKTATLTETSPRFSFSDKFPQQLGTPLPASVKPGTRTGGSTAGGGVQDGGTIALSGGSGLGGTLLLRAPVYGSNSISGVAGPVRKKR